MDPACPVAEHQHRQGGREPVGRRRGRRGGRRPGAVGRVGGAGRQRQRLRQPRPDLRLQGRQAGCARTRRAPASSRRRTRASATSAGSRSASTAWPRTAARRRDRRPDAEHRPQPQRRRARHRVHRPGRHRGVDRLVREGREPHRPAQQRAGLRGQDRQGPDADGGFRWQAVGNGTAGQVNILDTSGPTASARARSRRAPRTPAR